MPLIPEIEALRGRFAALAKALRAAGLLDPVNGPLTGMDLAPAEVRKVRLYFALDATAEQRVTVQTFVRDWDFAPRRPRTIADIMTDLAALPPADLVHLQLRDLAIRLQARPNMAREIGLNIDGDEPA